MTNIIALIRISGLIKTRGKLEEAMTNLRLRKKYTCSLVEDKPEIKGMINEVRNLIAYGKIDEKTLTELIKARGKKIGNTKAKIENPEKIAKEVFAGKKLEELGVKPFFGLHPARGGIDTKHHFPKGVLGEHKDISKLMLRML